MKYQPKIGLEIHLQLATKQKMFCACPVVGDEAMPNTAICPICTGQPGALPVPNAEAVELGLKLALALGCKINSPTHFDRKNYFYPDLPKGYQISQYDTPLGYKGKIAFAYRQADGKTTKTRIGITRVHLEEDTGKSMHKDKSTLIDLNRAGVPLCEIVSEPDITSPIEAKRYAQELQMLIKELGISTARLESGQMRVDVNVSLTGKGIASYRVEIKNLNSFASIEKALVFEIERQTALLDSNKTPVQETRGWNDQKNQTVNQRSKELTADYRYFPEPDIPAFKIESRIINKIKRTLPISTGQLVLEVYEKYGLDAEKTLRLNDLKLLNEALQLFKKNKKESDKIANLLISASQGFVERLNSSQRLNTIQIALSSKNFNASAWKNIDWHSAPKTSAQIKLWLKDKGVLASGNMNDITTVIRSVIGAYPDEVAKYKQGKEGLLSFLIGKVMRSGKAQANPQVIKETLLRELTK